MKSVFALGFLLCLGVFGCGGGESAPTSVGKNGGSPVGNSGAVVGQGCEGLELAPPDTGVQIFTEMALEPGEERQTCKLVMAGQDINLNYGEGIFTPGSHHATVWRTAYRDSIPTQNMLGQTVDTSQAVDCLSPGDWNGAGVVATGRPANSDVNGPSALQHALPEDVAFKIAANEVLLMNFHMINTGTTTAHVCYKQNLPSIPDSQVTSEAGLMFFYNQFITVPAGGDATADLACPVTQDITVSTAVSHMHRRGDGYTSSLYDGDPSQGGNVVRTLFESNEWDEPAVELFDPPLSFTAGQWIRFACNYHNGEQRDVAQGQETTDEMCMFIGAYWPRNAGWERCGFDGAGRNFGTGTMDGAGFVDCWNNSPRNTYGGGPSTSAARYASQRCVTESCPKVSALANDYIYRNNQAIATATCD
jgi:hypothetical protein